MFNFNFQMVFSKERGQNEGGNLIMISTETWWEKIFSGPLSIGINGEKVHQLEDESFLFLKEEEEELPQEVFEQQVDY